MFERGDHRGGLFIQRVDRAQHILLIEQRANVAKADASQLPEDLLGGQIQTFEVLSLYGRHLGSDGREQPVALMPRRVGGISSPQGRLLCIEVHQIFAHESSVITYVARRLDGTWPTPAYTMSG
jgi:hypothetical protein